MSKPVFSQEAIIKWLESKNPTETYEFCNSHICACAQYASTLGMTWNQAMHASAHFRAMNSIAGHVANREGRQGHGTFGDLAKAIKEENFDRLALEHGDTSYAVF